MERPELKRNLLLSNSCSPAQKAVPIWNNNELMKWKYFDDIDDRD